MLSLVGIAVNNEIAIALRLALRRVVLVDPEAPLPPVAMPVKSAAPEAASAEQPTKPAEDKQLQQERAAIQAVLDSVTAALQEFQRRETQRLTEMQQVAIELAVAIASRLTHAKIQAGDFGIEGLVREVLEQVDRQQPATLYLHPQDMALLERRAEDEPTLFATGQAVRLTADPALGRGNCRAEWGDVSILSAWQQQLPEIQQHLLRGITDARAGHRATQA